MLTLWQDVRHSLRVLRKSPGFTVAAVATLALGIGLNTAIFTVVNALLLRPLPVAHADRMVAVSVSQNGAVALPVFSYPEYQDVRRRASSAFSDMLAYRPGMDGMEADGRADRFTSAYVSPNFFAMLGLKPELGRLPGPEEGLAPGDDPVLVLSFAFWQSRFAGDPGVVGKHVRISGQPITVIGVLPRKFRGLETLGEPQGYLPYSMMGIDGVAGNFMEDRNLRWLRVRAFLRDGVDLAQARAVLEVIGQRLAQTYPDSNRGVSYVVEPERMQRIPSTGAGMVAASTLFLALAAAVLALACMNLTNLLLVRTVLRRREMALRAALGAARGRLMRQLLTESVLLSCLGGIAGLPIAAFVSSALGSLRQFSDLGGDLDFSLDARVFGYSFAAALVTGILVGLSPAWLISRVNLSGVLREGARGASPARQTLRSILVGGQIAGSLVLLIVAALFTRSLVQAQRMDIGFDPSGVVQVQLDPHQVGYHDEQTRAFYDELLRRVRTLPGVESASLACCGPDSAVMDMDAVVVEQGAAPDARQTPSRFLMNRVAPDFFETLRMPILEGRAFTDADNSGAPRVAVINQVMAERLWPGKDPIGRTFHQARDPQHEVRVIGVVRNSRSFALLAPPTSYYYVPLAQGSMSMETLLVRSRTAPEATLVAVEKQIAALAPGLPLADAEPMTDALGGLMGFLMFRMAAWLAAGFGLVGLVLAVIGVYGVVSYAAAQRTQEIGIRMALGARPADIRRLVLRHGMIVTACGLAVGLLLSAAVAFGVSRFLFGVAALDPYAFAAASFLLAGVTAGAIYIPSARAARSDPMAALRQE
jgi:macrolide transport system ATP-binding/permease protein